MYFLTTLPLMFVWGNELIQQLKLGKAEYDYHQENIEFHQTNKNLKLILLDHDINQTGRQNYNTPFGSSE